MSGTPVPILVRRHRPTGTPRICSICGRLIRNGAADHYSCAWSRPNRKLIEAAGYSEAPTEPQELAA